MAFQQARPYSFGPGALDTMGDIQRLQQQQQQNRLGELEFGLAQQKAIRADTAYQAQQQLLGQIKDPTQRLAALYAPDKFASSVFRDPKDRYVPDGRGGLWDLEAPNGPSLRGGRTGYTDMYGRPIGPMGGGQAPGQQPPAPAAGGPAGGPGGNLDLARYRTARRQFETGGHPNPNTAQNPNSTAQGPDQFIESTWERLMLSKGRAFIDMKIGPNANVNDPNVKAAIQALRNDEDVSGAMAEEYARENAAELQQANIPPTTRNLVVAHFLGGSGAKRFLSADPNDPAASHADPAQVKANQSVFFDKATGRARTVAEVLAEVDRRTGETGGQQPPGQASPQASGQASGSQLQPIYNDKGEFDTHFGLNTRTGQIERWPSQATTQINVGEKAGAKEIVEARVKRYETIATQGQNAQSMLHKLDLLQERLKDVGVQGPGAENFYSIVGTLEGLGVPRARLDQLLKDYANINMGDPAAVNNVQKLTNDFVSQQLKGLGANPTDMDAEMVMKTVPGINNLADANAWLMDNVLRPQLEKQISLWQQAIRIANDPNNPTLNGLDDLMFELGGQHQAMPPRTTQDRQAAATDTVPNPTTTQQPDPNRPPPTEQEIKAKYPNAIPLKSGGWATPDPTSSTGYRRIVVQ